MTIGITYLVRGCQVLGEFFSLEHREVCTSLYQPSPPLSHLSLFPLTLTHPLTLPQPVCSYGDMTEHFRVLEGAGQYYIWEESFCSLNRLVDFYRIHSIAMERTVYLRDPPTATSSRLSGPGRNPYPNPYTSSPQKSLSLSPHLPHASHPGRDSSLRVLEPVLGV